MSKKPRIYTAKFKFDRVVESLKAGNVSEVARAYGLQANLLSRWRSEFLEAGHHVFNSQPQNEQEYMKKKVANLEQLVGKKEVELNLMKNFLDFQESLDGR